MANESHTLIVGDLHASFRQGLNPLINIQQPSIILAVGDFGFWPEYPGVPSHPGKEIKNLLRCGERCEVRWCDGNHEDHAALRAIAGGSREPVEIGPRIFYQPRGSTFTLPDGRLVLFLGGAKSVDWRERTEGVDWFPDEILTIADLPDPLPRADIVVSHTAPARFPIRRDDDPCRWDCSPDPSREVLDGVFETVRPKQWFFGHFHRHRSEEIEGCRWVALAAVGLGGRWWVSLCL